MEEKNTKSAFISIVGRPNVGKSSLLNALCGYKIAIVTSKPQTTRTKINGILTEDDTQLVFTDTPGIHKPKTKLGEHMVKAVRESVTNGDMTVLVIECKKQNNLHRDELAIIDSFKAANFNAILVINKVDIVKDKTKIIKLIEIASKLYDFKEIIPLSAKTGDGVDILLDILKNNAVESPHYFPDDTLTDQPERVIASELIREKIMRAMSEEIPHGIAVEIEKFSQRKNGILDISCVIYCEKQNHKGMVIGKNGEILKNIATSARADIENFMQCKVNLQCWIKVKEDWRNREGYIKNFGLN